MTCEHCDCQEKATQAAVFCPQSEIEPAVLYLCHRHAADEFEPERIRALPGEQAVIVHEARDTGASYYGPPNPDVIIRLPG